MITFGVSAFLLAIIHRSWRLARNEAVGTDEEDRRVAARRALDADELDPDELAPDDRIAGHATLTLEAGDGFLIPPQTPHNARDLGPETGRMLSTYIVEIGQPLSRLTG